MPTRFLWLTGVVLCFALGMIRVLSRKPSHPTPPDRKFQAAVQASKKDCPADLCDSADRPKIRRHAWALWHGITEPTDPKDFWDKWQLKDPKRIQIKVRGNDKPGLEFPMEMVSSLFATNNLDPKHAVEVLRKHNGNTETLYNPAAYNYIHDNGLFSQESLDKDLKELAGASLQFPRESMIVKATWRSVAKLGNARVPIWKPPDCNDCPPDVLVVQGDQECNLSPTGTVPATIPTSCFYHVKAETSDTQFILVGLHLITKELPDWTWSTFWWYPRRNIKGYGDDRPPNISVPWNNYLMNTTIDMEQPEETTATPFHDSSDKTNDPCGQTIDKPSNANITYNFYLEGNLPNGDISNCMNCHKRATYPLLGESGMMGAPRRGSLSSNNACFADRMRLDYLWTLRQTPDKQSHPTQFSDFVEKINKELDKQMGLAK